MKKLFDKFRSNLYMNVIGALIALMTFFGFLICLVGNICFTNAFENEYSTATYHMADSVTVLVNGDHIDNYLNNEYEEEYQKMNDELDVQCHKLNVSLIYVLKFTDTENYSHYINVVNVVYNEVDNSSYTPWAKGYERDASDEEYQKKYKAIFDKKVAYETYFRHHPTNNQSPHITTMVPVKNSNGDVVAILCMQRPISEMASAMAPYLISIIVGVVIMGALLCAFAGYYLKHAVISPVEKVSIEAKRFAEETTKGEPLGEISKYITLQDLASSIDRMEEDTVNHINAITTMTSERERGQAELNIAAKIQQDMIPNLDKVEYDRNHFDISGAMIPAREVGGDFYNFVQIDDDHVAIYIADVSGKGVPAALIMMGSDIVLSNRSKLGGSPAEILGYTNKSVCHHNNSDMFVTAWLGIYEVSTGKLTSANAGHEDPVVYHNGKFEIVKQKHDLVLGAMGDIKYQEQEVIYLRPGDKLFIYTDGVPEATNKNDKLFGINNMVKSLNKHKEGSAHDIVSGIIEDVDKFVGDAPQFDDLTMVCIEVKK